MGMGRATVPRAACLAAAILAVPTALLAATGVTFHYRVTDRVEAGQKVRLTISPLSKVKYLSLSLRRREDGKRLTFDAGGIGAGEEREFSFDQPEGRFRYQASLAATDDDDRQTHLTFDFQVLALRPLEVEVHKDRCNVEERRIVLSASRPIARIEGVVTDDQGFHVTAEQTYGAPAGQPVVFTWSQPEGRTVGRIDLKVVDQDGFWAGVALLPFWVEIPHEEVVFEFGKWEILPTEEPKLRATLARIQEEMARHGADLEIRLYVAGYTDTVGSDEDNLRLSLNRARAIGTWFRKAGLKIPIFYQGFGERVLAVQTPDNVPEPRNRRALYILGSTLPPSGNDLPARDWRKL